MEEASPLSLPEGMHVEHIQIAEQGVVIEFDAVQAGLTWPINNGVVEGHVPKLKLIKRMMYGRAGFALLRKRGLHAV